MSLPPPYQMSNCLSHRILKVTCDIIMQSHKGFIIGHLCHGWVDYVYHIYGYVLLLHLYVLIIFYHLNATTGYRLMRLSNAAWDSECMFLMGFSTMI